MATTVYKGFACYYIDPTTKEELQFAGNIEIPIFDSPAGNSGARVYTLTDPTSVAILNNRLSEVTNGQSNKIGGLFHPGPYSGYGAVMQQYAPLALDLAANNTGVTAQLKLKAANGSYMIYDTNYPNGSNTPTRASYQVQGALCYNADGVYLGVLGIMPPTMSGPVFLRTHLLQPDGNITAPGPTDYNERLYATMLAAYDNYREADFRYSDYDTQIVANAWLVDFLNGIGPLVPPPPPDTDPYAPGGTTGPGGGTGTFSDTSTPIDFPPLPSISVEDTGFINLWNPSASQLRLLADYMWDTSLFDLNTWHKLFADPMDAILGLSIVPVTIPNGATQFVIVGNITTTVPMTRAGAQFIEVDCGSLTIEERWGAYLDYSPYTKAELYLPYCGTHSIDVDNIMGKTVHIKYHVDILSGSCCAYVKCGDSILYSFIGQCSSSIPVNGADFTTMINGVIQAATAVGSMVPSGGMAAPMAAPNLAQMVPNLLKPEIEKSGSMSGTGGMLALQTPYLILTRPNQALPAHQNHYTGYPSFITQTLGDLSGYTEVELIHLEGIPATGDELDELENILKSGVIF